MSAAVWLVVGVQAAGKSTTAQLLAERFPRSVHVRGDQVRRWAVNGWSQPGRGDDVEARRLLDLRYRLSATIADEYAAAGFTTVVQDNLYGETDVSGWLARVAARPRHLVVLRPSVEVVRRREAERTARTGKVAYVDDGPTVEDLDAAIARTVPLGLWLDTSALTADEVVDTIVARAAEAKLPDD